MATTTTKLERIKSLMDLTMIESNHVSIRIKNLALYCNFTNGVYTMCLDRQAQLNRRFYKLYGFYKASL